MGSIQGTSVDPKRRRRKIRNRILVLGFFLFIGVVMALESPLTRVKGFAVTGNKSVQAQSILDASGLEPGMSLWQVNGNHVAGLVEAAQPRIDTVEITTNYFSRMVTLAVTEKPIVAIFQSGDKFYELLSDGKVYAPEPASNGFTWPIVTASITTTAQLGQVPTQAVEVVCHQLKEVSPAEANGISEIHIDTFGVVRIYLLNHFAVECKAESLADSMKEVQSAVGYFQKKGYAPGLIDMTGGPPYRYTPFTTPQERKS